MVHCPGAHVDRGQHAQQHAQVFLQLRVVAAEQILRPLQLRGIVGIVGNLGRDILGHQIQTRYPRTRLIFPHSSFRTT